MGSQLSVLLLQAQQNQDKSDQRVAKAESEANEAQQKVEREAAQTMQAAAGEKETLEELRRRASKEIEVLPNCLPNCKFCSVVTHVCQTLVTHVHPLCVNCACCCLWPFAEAGCGPFAEAVVWASANAGCGQDAQRHAQEATGAQKLMAEEALKAKEMAMHEVLRAKEEAADKVQPNATPPACIPPHGQCTWTVLLHVSYHMDSASSGSKHIASARKYR